MRRVPVTSSTLASVGYDSRRRILEVQFRHGGIYRYLDVPIDVYESFMGADSLGGFLTRVIKPAYEFRRVD